MAEPQTLHKFFLPRPPPPKEVKVRTLKSDLASIAATGGGLPRYTNMNIVRVDDGTSKSKAGIITTVVIIVLFAIIVAIAVYFVDQLVLKKYKGKIS